MYMMRGRRAVLYGGYDSKVEMTRWGRLCRRQAAGARW